jgi:DNA-binding NarL/FixJ family response regulator
MIVDADRITLLIVEDDRFIRKLYTEILKDINKIDLQELDTAENAIEYIKKNKPDIVLMDYKLPGMNGLEATKQIIMAHPDTIVLVISGDDRSTLEEEMLEVGAVSFLKKPVRGKLLYFTVLNFAEIILSKKQLKKHLDQQTAKKSASKPTSKTPKPAPKKAQTASPAEEKSTTFVTSFKNTGIDGDAANLLNGQSDSKTPDDLMNMVEGEYEYVEDYIDAYDRLKYCIDRLGTDAEPEIIIDTAHVIKDNAVRLNKLLEFPTIVYTLSNIAEFIEALDMADMGEIPIKKLAVFLCDFFEMYEDWVKSVFVIKDASDIHHMDISLMSYGLQMDSIFSDLNVLTEDDESAVDEGGSVEFF